MGSRKFWRLRRNAVRNKRKPVSSALLLLQVQSNLLNREKRASIRVLISTPSASPFGICFLVECRSSGARSKRFVTGTQSRYRLNNSRVSTFRREFLRCSSRCLPPTQKIGRSLHANYFPRSTAATQSLALKHVYAGGDSQ